MKKTIGFVLAVLFLFNPNMASAKKYYFHEDHLGGASIMTDEDGEVVAEYQYYPYGGTYSEETSGEDFGNSYKYTGQEEDSEIGLYYYGSRYYNPEVTKFMSRDPAVYDERFLEMLRDPQSFNTYAYVRNNPIKYIDPSGEYVVETGGIEDGDTKDSITTAVNDALGIAATWDGIATVSFFQDNFGTTDPSELVGHYTYVGTDYVTDCTDSLDNLNNKHGDEALNHDYGLIRLGVYFRSGGPWDLKNNYSESSTIFGSESKYLSYIYHGRLIRWDAPGNIHYGYVMNKAGYSLNTSLVGGNLASSWLSDDAYDQRMIVHGYHNSWDSSPSVWTSGW